MPKKPIFIISDLHLGSPHFKRDNFHSFLDSLPENSCLILNGDTIDQPASPLPQDDQDVLNRLLSPPVGREIIWIEGNHDNAALMEQKWKVRMLPYLSLGPPLNTLVIHGVCFDTLGCKLRHGVSFFRTLHNLRVRLGMSSVHFAEYAKSWRFMYFLMRRTVRSNAVSHARGLGRNVVVCGHVHKPEKRLDGDVHYFNTGSWLDPENYYLVINGLDFKLSRWN